MRVAIKMRGATKYSEIHTISLIYDGQPLKTVTVAAALAVGLVSLGLVSLGLVSLGMVAFGPG
jgi:hypothetical protein